MSRRQPHRAGSYDARRKALLASATPWSRCWRCGKLLQEHPAHKSGKPARWEAGHLVDGDPRSPLALEASVCNRRAGGKLGAQRGGRRFTQWREPRSPNA